VPAKFIKQFALVRQKIPFQMPLNHYYLNWPPTLHKDPGHMWLRALCAKVIRKSILAPASGEI